jgi:conserved oligomeric Golgi complex subunit 2
VWHQVSKALTTNMSTAFSPGNPDVFHQSVLSATRIYQGMEAAAISDVQADNLRQSPATRELWRHWNLPVYFQLRFQEITSTYDNCLRMGPVAVDEADTEIGTPNSSGDVAGSSNYGSSKFGISRGCQHLRSDMYQVKATVAMIEALRRCWSDNVYLRPLSHRFLRLSFQLLARYVTWVRTGLAGDWPAAVATPTGVARVHADVTTMLGRLPGEFIRVLRRPEIGIDPDLLQEIDSAFSSAIASPEQSEASLTPSTLATLLSDLESFIADALSRSCVDNLQPLRGMLATYRVSSRPAPATHSSFVPKVLLPLKVFLRDQRGPLADVTCLKISTAVAEETTEKYWEMATDLLSSNKKSEETLRRLNIGGAAGDHGSRSTMTDKVSIQLYLDVAKFRDDVEAVGVPLTAVPSMPRLWECVKRETSADAGEVKSSAHASSGVLMSGQL